MKLAIGASFLVFLAFAGSSRAKTKGSSSEAPVVTISVFDRSNLPATLLTAAEEDAHRIFRQAGIETLWLNCSQPFTAGPGQQIPCGTIGAGYFVAEILPGENSERLRFHSEVLGTATLSAHGDGFHCYLFYGRIQSLATERRLLERALLAAVLVHEAGHLLLGSNSHSVDGIMSGQWSGKGLRQVSQRAMFFSPAESNIMRQRLSAHQTSERDHFVHGAT